MEKIREHLAVGALVLSVMEPSLVQAKGQEIFDRVEAVKQCIKTNLAIRQGPDGSFEFYPQENGGSVGIKVAFLDSPEQTFFEIQRYLPTQEPPVFDYIFDEGADGVQEDVNHSSPFYSVILTQFLDRYCGKN